MTKDMTLNQAIVEVLTTQFKKDAKEAHKMVADAGYSITKYNGAFSVYNEKTDRRIHICDNGRRKTLYHGNYNSQWKNIRYDDDLYKFDYVGCLEKPQNKDYYKQLCDETRHEYDKSEAIKKMRDAKWSVNYSDRRIANIQKEIEKLQRELIYAGAEKQRAMDRLNSVRKDLGLRQR